PASVDPARRPLLHPRFLAEEIIASLFDDHPDESGPSMENSDGLTVESVDERNRSDGDEASGNDWPDAAG
ncbi:hypothetical protein ACMZ29_10340, partial [Brevibacterium casei]|uniref:hypothetical protein n=2 Tax=Brevibacterium casei TaxID=33889 RepID=UPI0039EE402B